MMLAKNGGVKTPPQALFSQRSEIGLNPSPQCHSKSEMGQPLARNHVFFTQFFLNRQQPLKIQVCIQNNIHICRAKQIKRNVTFDKK